MLLAILYPFPEQKEDQVAPRRVLIVEGGGNFPSIDAHVDDIH